MNFNKHFPTKNTAYKFIKRNLISRRVILRSLSLKLPMSILMLFKNSFCVHLAIDNRCKYDNFPMQYWEELTTETGV